MFAFLSPVVPYHYGTSGLLQGHGFRFCGLPDSFLFFSDTTVMGWRANVCHQSFSGLRPKEERVSINLQELCTVRVGGKGVHHFFMAW